MNPLANLQQFDIAGSTQNALLQGMQVGAAMRQRREAREREKATDEAYRGIYQGDPNAVNALAQVPGMGKAAYELQGSIQDRMEQGRKQMAQMADLLDDSTDEASYQRNLAVAQQLYGQLPPSVPRNFDPNWIAGQRRIVDIMLREPSKLTNMAQELVNAGYEPGTPEFIAQMRQRIALGDTKIISTTDGGMAGTYGANGYQPLIVPNPGNQAPGAPAGGASLPPGFVLDNGGQPGGNRPFDGKFNPRGLQGERVTSTYRTPSRNAAVGGVENSYHMRRGIDGRPLARDSVPPAGMSMGEYHRRLKALNPNYDVINEGDHVHMEPKG